MTRRGAAKFVASLAFAMSSCASPDVCTDEHVACGGDPTGVWGVDDTCRAPAFAGPQRITYLGQPATGGGQAPPEQTSSDWCSNLQYEPSRDPGQRVTLFFFPFDTLLLPAGTLRYEADGSYRGLFLTYGRGTTELSISCLTRFGGNPTCADLESELTRYASAQPSFRDITCMDGIDGGCSCSYTLSFDGAYNGHFSAEGGVLTHFSTSGTLPSRADYCVSGDTMTMWSHDRATILDSPPGLRTLHLTRKP